MEKKELIQKINEYKNLIDKYNDKNNELKVQKEILLNEEKFIKEEMLKAGILDNNIDNKLIEIKEQINKLLSICEDNKKNLDNLL